jgi:formate dehydrogenase major subunit
MIHLTIDGKQIEVAEGTTVLRAAQHNGIHIPTLCDHPHLAPYGGCRLCLVEVKGARTLMPSCTIPASEGMEVTTSTPKITEARKFVLSMIFSERNHFCPYCQVSGGDCELQNSAYEQDMTHWMIQPNWSTFRVDASHPWFTHEANRCILCRRCVRTCNEMVGNNTLGIEMRGASSMIIADLNVPLGESTCISCGMCVQNCPTGAMMDNRSAYLGLAKDAESIKSICTGCSVGCGIEVFYRDNNIIKIDGDYDNTINTGVICKFGRWTKLYEFDDAEKFSTPLIRTNGKLEPASWEEALEKTAELIKSTQDDLAAVISSELTCQSLYGFISLFKDHLSAKVVTSVEGPRHSTALKKIAGELGGSFEGSLSSIDIADCIITIGEDFIKHHEVVGFMIKRNLSNNEAKLVCIDSDNSSYEQYSNNLLTITPGSEKEIIKGLVAALVKLGLKTCDCDGCTDPDSIVQAAAKACGLSSDSILDAAYAIGTSANPVILFGGAITDDPKADALETLICLSKMIDGKLITVKGKANSLAASQYGLDNTQKIAKKGETLIAVLADDQLGDKWSKLAKGAKNTIVLATYQTEFTQTADIVLPVCNWAQEQGHFVNFEGKIQWREKLVDAGPDVKSTAEVLSLLAKHLDFTIPTYWREALTAAPASVEIQ